MSALAEKVERIWREGLTAYAGQDRHRTFELDNVYFGLVLPGDEGDISDGDTCRETFTSVLLDKLEELVSEAEDAGREGKFPENFRIAATTNDWKKAVLEPSDLRLARFYIYTLGALLGGVGRTGTPKASTLGLFRDSRRLELVCRTADWNRSYYSLTAFYIMGFLRQVLLGRVLGINDHLAKLTPSASQILAMTVAQDRRGLLQLLKETRPLWEAPLHTFLEFHTKVDKREVDSWHWARIENSESTKEIYFRSVIDTQGCGIRLATCFPVPSMYVPELPAQQRVQWRDHSFLTFYSYLRAAALLGVDAAEGAIFKTRGEERGLSYSGPETIFGIPFFVSGGDYPTLKRERILPEQSRNFQKLSKLS